MVVLIAALASVATLLAGCGGDDAASDLTTKPVIDSKYLGSFDELEITDLVEGDGAVAATGDQVEVHYVGALGADGSEFDTSWARGQPFTFTLGSGQVIAGWDQGIAGMKVGGRRVLQIPAGLAYGPNSPGPDIPANSDLVFIADLVDIPPPAPTPTPHPDLPEIPGDAMGPVAELETIDVVEGSGTPVERGDILAVQYLGVYADDGIEFDSSWSRGGTPFRMTAGGGGLIEGWQLGLIGMQLGGERIIKIPADQAYGDRDLVFRIHLEEHTAAPDVHRISFDGPVPSEVKVSTLVKGDGEAVDWGMSASSNVIVMRHSDSLLLQSSYTTGSPTSLFVTEEQGLSALNDALVGTLVGETRQVIIPAELVYPDGVPESADISADDALVFIVEVLSLES